MADPDNRDGYIHVKFTGDGSEQTYTLPTDRPVFSIQFRVIGEDATFDDEDGIEYVIPAGQAESINAKSMAGWIFRFTQATSAGKVYIRVLYGKGV